MIKFIKANQNAAETFTARSYYGRNFSGLEDSVENVSLSEAEDFCHEHLMNGGYVELEDDLSGISVGIDPDYYAENFDGEFYCTPELNRWHKRVFGF